MALYESLDPTGRWAVERVVARERAVWVYTRRSSDARAQAAMTDTCRALHNRFSWARSVLVVDRERSMMIGARTPNAKCEVVGIAERFGG